MFALQTIATMPKYCTLQQFWIPGEKLTHAKFDTIVPMHCLIKPKIFHARNITLLAYSGTTVPHETLCFFLFCGVSIKTFSVFHGDPMRSLVNNISTSMPEEVRQMFQ